MGTPGGGKFAVAKGGDKGLGFLGPGNRGVLGGEPGAKTSGRCGGAEDGRKSRGQGKIKSRGRGRDCMVGRIIEIRNLVFGGREWGGLGGGGKPEK